MLCIVTPVTDTLLQWAHNWVKTMKSKARAVASGVDQLDALAMNDVIKATPWSVFQSSGYEHPKRPRFVLNEQGKSDIVAWRALALEAFQSLSPEEMRELQTAADALNTEAREPDAVCHLYVVSSL